MVLALSCAPPTAGRPSRAVRPRSGALTINGKTAKRFSHYAFLLLPTGALSALGSSVRLFQPSPASISPPSYRLSSGAALVNAAPLFHPPAILVINQSAFTHFTHSALPHHGGSFFFHLLQGRIVRPAVGGATAARLRRAARLAPACGGRQAARPRAAALNEKTALAVFSFCFLVLAF
jgi:hypothetical protein